MSGEGVSLSLKRPSRVTLFFKWNNSSLSPTQQTVGQTETDSAPLHLFCLVVVLFVYFFTSSSHTFSSFIPTDL